MKSLKSVLKFWQEIILVVPTGYFLIEIAKYVMRSQTVDVWVILLASWLLPLFICLIIQLFRKSEALAVTLSVLLGLSSVIVILLAIIGLVYSPSYNHQHISMFIIGVISVFAVITMPRKYNSNINADTLVKQ